MLGSEYTLEFLPQFEEDLREVANYISFHLNNPQAADKLIDDTFSAIYERQEAPESFQSYPSTVERKYPYYRISIGNYTVLYVVIGKVMEVRRFIYSKRDWHSWRL